MKDNLDVLIDPYLERLLGIEGGYVNNPQDAGGPTRWGVTEAVARAHGYSGDMQHLPRDRARAILAEHHFVAPGFRKVAEVFPALALELFEIEVNLPPRKAVTFLQNALNAFNDPDGISSPKQLYPDLTVDGFYGGGTHQALIKYLERRRKEGGETTLLTAVNAQQGAYYLDRTAARKANKAFVYGWFRHRVAL